jgi:hypothetical protein
MYYCPKIIRHAIESISGNMGWKWTMLAAQPLDVFSFETGSLNHTFFPIAYGHEILPHSVGKGNLGKISGLNKNKCKRRLEI